MASTFAFVLTDAGMAAASHAQQGGPKINVTTVKLGSAVGYLPTVADTGLRGTQLYSGPITDYRVDNQNQVSYTIRLDQNVGDFSFGECGLYLADGTLFALAALDKVQEKVTAKLSTPGNVVSFIARLLLTNIAPVINFTSQVLANAKIIEVPNLESLTLATDLNSPNAFSVQSGDDAGNAILALRQSTIGLWGFTTHRNVIIEGECGAGTNDTTIASADIANILVNKVIGGKYIIQITSGARQSYCRYIDSSTVNQAIFASLGGVAPAEGDTFQVYQSDYSTRLNPTAVTQPFGTNSTLLATCEFVQTALSSQLDPIAAAIIFGS